MFSPEEDSRMKRTVKFLLTVSLFSLLSNTSWAQDDLLASVKDGCKKDLDSYCKEVTPGEGRILACLYAYQDKLSSRCEYALYDASAQLEHAVATLTYVANECSDDLKKHCAAVEAGGGRLAACLKKNEKDVSARCKTAMKDVGVK